MNDPLEEQAVTDFVLESKTNIDAAARMAKVFPIVQRHIVLPVIDELEEKLRASLGKDWVIYNFREEIFVKNYPGFTVSRQSWGGIYINLENRTRERSSVVGIWRLRDSASAVLDEALVSAFAKANLSGEANRWWAWYQELPPDRGNWSGAPALFKMHCCRNEAVEYLAEEVLRIHRIAAPVIDRFISKQ